MAWKVRSNFPGGSPAVLQDRRGTALSDGQLSWRCENRLNFELRAYGGGFPADRDLDWWLVMVLWFGWCS
ncbi:hypothetical protein ES708_21463 [subsurface metagenome]